MGGGPDWAATHPLFRSMSDPDHKVRLLMNSVLEIAPHDSELRESKENRVLP